MSKNYLLEMLKEKQPMNGFKYQNIPIVYDGSTARVHLSGRFQIKKYKDDFSIAVTVDDENRKLFEEFEISSQL